MYLVRFCYYFDPSSRDAVIEIIREEVEAAESRKLRARLLIPQTRGREGAALEYELEVPRLDVLDDFRETGIEGDEEETRDWMRSFSDLLTEPPTVTIYRIDGEVSGG